MKKLLCLSALLCFSFAGCDSGGIKGTAEDRAATDAGNPTPPGGTAPVGAPSVATEPVVDAPKEDAAGVDDVKEGTAPAEEAPKDPAN